jgi:hypothetical protein
LSIFRTDYNLFAQLGLTVRRWRPSAFRPLFQPNHTTLAGAATPLLLKTLRNNGIAHGDLKEEEEEEEEEEEQ